MPTINAGGVDLFYTESGSGQPVLFVHGIPTDYRAWNRQVQKLSKNHRVVAVSRRYAAPNARSGDMLDSTVGNNAADMKALVEKLGLAPVHLVGHSYGGFISAFLAADHPDLVRSLVLVEPAVSTMLVADQNSPVQLLALLLRSPTVALSARKFQSRALNPSLRALAAGQTDRAAELMVDGVQDSPGAFGRLNSEARQMMLQNGRTVGELRTRFPQFGRAEASRIACKTLVVNGESSPLWLRRIGQLLSAAIPKCSYARIPGSAHFPHMDNPAGFNGKLLEFLSAA
ncbi:MAG: alpha/beta hydrolase [Nitrososphaerales archaeon]|nr:alpha/beta hydrolase [Nitrososphaerales archaeon]